MDRLAKVAVAALFFYVNLAQAQSGNDAMGVNESQDYAFLKRAEQEPSQNADQLYGYDFSPGEPSRCEPSVAPKVRYPKITTGPGIRKPIIP